jgi:hypothetical protein
MDISADLIELGRTVSQLKYCKNSLPDAFPAHGGGLRWR